MSPEYVDDPELNQRAAARKKEAAEKAVSDRTLAEQIMLNADAQRVTIDLHGIPVVIRAPLTAELAELREYITEGNSAEMIKLLADLCIDESLDEEFFTAGMITKLDLELLFEGISGVDKEMLDKIQKFRAGKKRARAAKPVPKSR